MSILHSAWRIWAKTIGSKIGDDRESDIAAILRTIWVWTHLVACFFIIAHNGVKLGWF
jgi:hypothetical protein